MTPVERNAKAAKDNPKLAQELMPLNFMERERRVSSLVSELKASGGNDAEIAALYHVLGHVETITQSDLRRTG